MSIELECARDLRRRRVRERGLTGLDYVEVSGDQRRLTVYFLGRAPKGLRRGNVRIDGGQAATGLQVTALDVHRSDDPELDDSATVTVDRRGDFSIYRLRLVELDERGRQTERPLAGVDPRYAELEVNFKIGCSSDLDCAVEEPCPPPELDDPQIDYLAKDYASFRRLILDRLAQVMPDWRERHVPDLGIALVELLAYTGDYLSYEQDAVATEAYIGTARRRVSVRRHARLVDYLMHEGCNARAFVCVQTDQELELHEGDYFVAGQGPAPRKPAAPLADLGDGIPGLPFAPMRTSERPIVLRPGQHEIAFHTWGERECCLPRGATGATLRDRWLDRPGEDLAHAVVEQIRAAQRPEQKPRYEPPDEERPRQRLLDLHVGDFLICEEVRGARTGREEDADQAHRHVVRLTSVEQGVDELYEQPVVSIEWAPEDALPFPLCVSAVVGEDCRLEEISVARGNVVLADHGLWASPQRECVEAGSTEAVCEGEGRHSEVSVVAKPFRPWLAERPPTFSEPLATDAPAARILRQDPARARAQLRVTSEEGSREWWPRADLLASGPDDRHVVAEIDDDARARLRFGDGELGARPEPSECFELRQRVGNGPIGNVPAEAISRLVTWRRRVDGVNVRVRNPLAAAGGTAAETTSEARLRAPEAFRLELLRAVSEEDYARLAAKDDPSIQRASATLRWTGSWYEVHVGVDPAGSGDVTDEQLARMAARLERYRRMGHDIRVAAAEYVPLDVALKVCVKAGHLRGRMRAALLDRLGTHVLADGRRGLFHPDELSFGTPVYASRIVAAAAAVPGVETAVLTRFQRLGEPSNRELELGVLELGPLEVARLDNDPNRPGNGVLRLELEGGR
jgi:Baseplate J-like protein